MEHATSGTTPPASDDLATDLQRLRDLLLEQLAAVDARISEPSTPDEDFELIESVADAVDEFVIALDEARPPTGSRPPGVPLSQPAPLSEAAPEADVFVELSYADGIELMPLHVYRALPEDVLAQTRPRFYRQRGAERVYLTNDEDLVAAMAGAL